MIRRAGTGAAPIPPAASSHMVAVSWNSVGLGGLSGCGAAASTFANRTAPLRLAGMLALL